MNFRICIGRQRDRKQEAICFEAPRYLGSPVNGEVRRFQMGRSTIRFWSDSEVVKARVQRRDIRCLGPRVSQN